MDKSAPSNAQTPSNAQAVALLGHDLRATLSEVIGGLRLIAPDLLPPAQRGHLARTQAATEALALLLEQALALLNHQPPAAPIGLHTEHQTSAAARPAVIPANPNLLQGRRVLVADDSDTGQLLLAHLASHGAEVTEAADGLQVLKHLSQARFDALLIDIDMPHTSGPEVIRHIRSQSGPLAHLPILAITADHTRADDAAIRTAGADGLLCKPLPDADTLCAALMQVMHRKPGDEPAAPQIEPAQFQDLLDMAGPKMAAELLDHLQKDLRTAKRGLIAASRNPDWLEVRRQTHVIIALAGTAGASLLHQLAQSMNALAHQPVPDGDNLQQMLPQTLEQLDMLIHFIDQKSAHPAPHAPAQEQT